MIKTRKKLIAQLVRMDHKLHCQQIKVKEHQKYFFEVFKAHQIIFFGTLFSSFAFGWKLGKKGTFFAIFKTLARAGMMSIISYFNPINKRQLPVLK